MDTNQHECRIKKSCSGLPTIKDFINHRRKFVSISVYSWFKSNLYLVAAMSRGVLPMMIVLAWHTILLLRNPTAKSGRVTLYPLLIRGSFSFFGLIRAGFQMCVCDINQAASLSSVSRWFSGRKVFSFCSSIRGLSPSWIDRIPRTITSRTSISFFE